MKFSEFKKLQQTHFASMANGQSALFIVDIDELQELIGGLG